MVARPADAGAGLFKLSRQMTGLLNGQRGEWSAKWRMMCEGLDPLAPADENRLADIAAAWTEYLHHCKQQGLHFIQPGRFVLPGDMAGAPALQFFPWPDVDAWGESKLAQADKHTNAGMLRERFNYYCEKVVKGFYKNHFLRFDRQIVLVDCLQPLNSGPQAFNDMRLALTQLMQSFHYGQRTLFRRLFSPVIDKLLFAATKADHVTIDQHANMVSLLQQLIQDAWQNAASKGSVWTVWGWRLFRRPPAELLMLTVRKSRRCAVIDSAMAHRSLFILAKFPHVCQVRRSGISKASSLRRFVRR